MRPRTTLCTLLLYYLLFDWLSGCHITLLSSVISDRSECQTYRCRDSRNRLHKCCCSACISTFESFFVLSSTEFAFGAIQIKFFFLMKISTRESTAAFQKLQFSVVEEQTNENSTDDLADNAI